MNAAENAVFGDEEITALVEGNPVRRDHNAGLPFVRLDVVAPNARLNILAANGSQLRATTWGDTLSVLRRHDGVVLASEPYDDNPDWQEVPDRHLVVAGASRVELIPLKGS